MPSAGFQLNRYGKGVDTIPDQRREGVIENKYVNVMYRQLIDLPHMLLGYMKTLTLTPMDLGGKLDLNLARTTPLLP